MIDLRAFGSQLTEIKAPNEYGVLTKYTVDEVFPYHIKCHSDTGRVECFGVGDLTEIGVITSKKRLIYDTLRRTQIPLE